MTNARVTVISRAELRALPEYSCSVPTGQTVGKRWRRNMHFGSTIEPEWMIGEYIDHANPAKIGIRWTWAVDENHDVHRGTLEDA